MQPEGAVFGKEVGSLVAAVAVHAVRVDHEIETLSGLLEGVNELEGILEMDVVVTGAVGEFQHDRLGYRQIPMFLMPTFRNDMPSPMLSGHDGNRIAGNIFQDAGGLVAVRVGLRGLHITLGIMRVIQFPVIYSAPCYAVVELLRSTEKKHGSHRASERETFDTYLVCLYIRK